MFARPIVIWPVRDTEQSHVTKSLEDFAVTELHFERPRRGPRPRPLTSIQTVDELPPYLAEVVKAVANGVETTREFAERQNVSIGAARERFRVAKNLGWIRVVEELDPQVGG